MALAIAHRFITPKVFVLLIIAVEWTVFSVEAKRIRRNAVSNLTIHACEANYFPQKRLLFYSNISSALVTAVFQNF